jgi:hypothetical protein
LATKKVQKLWHLQKKRKKSRNFSLTSCVEQSEDLRRDAIPKGVLDESELEQNVGNRSERCKRDEETKKLRSCSVVVRGLFLFEFLVFDE